MPADGTPAMSRARRAFAVCAPALALTFFLAGASGAAQPRRNRLPAAWSSPGAVRSVLFVRGMTCRACTMLLDRSLNASAGVLWARFNFPLRLLVVYHDPKTAPLSTITTLVSSAGELRAETVHSGPAGRFAPGGKGPIASWKGGALTRGEAKSTLDRFAASLRNIGIDEGSDELDQFSYEILGEEVRTRVLKASAAAAGFGTGPPGTTLPTVIPREFYWPADALDPTPEEAGIARYLREKVLLGDEGEKGRARFDDWLLALWLKTELEFFGEHLELKR